MEVKAILEKIRSKKEEEKEYFFAVRLEDGLVKSALWTIEAGKVEVLSFGEKQSWEKEEELLEAVDASLPQTDAEVKKVIYGVAESIKLDLLKKISHELELTPIGFVVTGEAIIHFLKVTEGIPLTAILVGQTEKILTLTLVNLGKIIKSELVNRSEDFGADLAEGLSRFAQETFPSRILLYNDEENLEPEKEQLMNFSWEKANINFLHLPKIEPLPKDTVLKAICLAGGREIAGVSQVAIKTTTIAEPAVEEEPPISTMGFVRGKDVTVNQPPPVKETPVGETLLPAKKKITIPRFKLPKINFKLPSFKKINLPRLPITFGLVAILMLIIVGSLIAAWWYYPKATVVLNVKSQILEKDFTFNLDPAQTIEVTLDTEKTISTTGTKLVGESARGEVTIYNRTSLEKTFASQTEVIGPNNLKFTLDEKVIIASESAGDNYTTIPGNVKVKVTAMAIGSDSNLAAGAEFSVANFSKSDYVAKNEEAFSGGTSREVQVVSKDDQKRLMEEAIAGLKGQALTDLKNKIGLSKDLVDESLSPIVVERNFNREVEEEATELTLKIKVKFSVLTYSKEEFMPLVEEEVKKSIPQGYIYKPEESQISFSLKEIKPQGAAVLLTHLKTDLFPELDIEQIKKNLSGKSLDIGKNYLGALALVDSFEVKFNTHLPIKLVVFPRVLGNIKVEIKKK